jgi:lycopene cyclase domain-containing protein
MKLKKFAHYFAFAFTLAGFSFGLMHMEQWYTASACIISALLTIGIYFVNRPAWYAQFIFTFLVAMIPFIIVNGILTGAVTDEPIVWYSENHIMGPRIITIPIEDIFYNYCMLLPIVGLFELFSKRWVKPFSQ